MTEHSRPIDPLNSTTAERNVALVIPASYSGRASFEKPIGISRGFAVEPTMAGTKENPR